MTTTPDFNRDGFLLVKSAINDAPVNEWLRAAARRMETALALANPMLAQVRAQMNMTNSDS